MESSFLKEFLAGNVGGLIGICVVYPLDTAKIRLQTSTQYKSTWDVLQTMIKLDGVQSIYRGIPAPAVGFGLTFAISFSSYGFCCRSISNYQKKDVSQMTLSEMTLAGAITGVVQTPVRQVVERIKSGIKILHYILLDLF